MSIGDSGIGTVGPTGEVNGWMVTGVNVSDHVGRTVGGAGGGTTGDATTGGAGGGTTGGATTGGAGGGTTGGVTMGGAGGGTTGGATMGGVEEETTGGARVVIESGEDREKIEKRVERLLDQ